MNRRAFLSMLGMGGAAAVALQSLPFSSLVFDPTIVNVAVPVGVSTADITAITQHVAHALDRQIGAYSLLCERIPAGGKVGWQIQYRGHPVMLTEQYNVGVRMPEGREIQKCEIDTIADALASAAIRDGVNVFGDLGVPVGQSALVRNERVSVRGWMSYDIMAEDNPLILRFDVLGGRWTVEQEPSV